MHPERGLTHCLLHHPGAQGHDVARFFRQRNEHPRRYRAKLGVRPAQQRLGPGDAPGRHVDLGLVVHSHPLQPQRLAHGVLHLHASQQVGIHLRLVKAIAAATTLLDPIHRGVGLLDQVVQRGAILRVQRNADTALDREPHAVEREGLEHVVQNPARHTFGRRCIPPMQVDDKFIPAQTAQHVGLPQAGLQAFSHQLQHPVSKRVPQGVIDDLEAVHVQEQDRKAGIALARPLDGGVHALREQQTVGKTGQRVAVGQLFNALLRGMLQREVAHEADALHQPPFIITQGHPGQLHRAVSAVVTGKPQLALPEAILGPALQHLLHEGGVRAPAKQRGRHTAFKTLGHRADQPLTPGVHPHDAVLAVGDEDRIQAGLKHARGQTQAGLSLGLPGDVPERIHTAHCAALAELRHRAHLQHHAVAQLDNVGALLHGLTVDGCQALGIEAGVRHLVCHEGVHRRIVALHQQLARQVPQLGQALVECAHTAIQSTHQHAIGGRVQRGTQLGQQCLQLAFSSFLEAAVQHGQKQHLATTLPPWHPPHTTLHRHQAAISTQQTRMGSHALRNHIDRLRPERQLLGRAGQVQHRPPSHGGGRQPSEALGACVGLQDVLAGLIQDPHGLLQAIQPPERLEIVHAAASSGSGLTARSKK